MGVNLTRRALGVLRAHRLAEFGLWSVLLAQVAWACTDPVDTVTWPELDTTRIVFAAVSRPGELLSYRGPFTPGAEALPTLREMVPEGARLHLLELDPEAISNRVPALAPDRITTLELQVRTGACRAVEYRPGFHALSLENAHGRAWVLIDDAFSETPLSGLDLAVRVPVDDAECLPRRLPELSAFGAAPLLLAGGTPPRVRPEPRLDNASRLSGAAELGPNRILAGSEDFLFVFERGAPWVEDASRYWDASQLPLLSGSTGRWLIISVLAQPSSSNSEPARVLVLLEWRDEPDVVGPSQVVELHWSSVGFTPPRTVYAPAARLDFIGWLPDGRALALGRSGTAAVESPDGQSMIELRDSGLDRASLQSAAPGPSDEEPLVILDSRHTLHFGRPEPGAAFRSEPSPWELPAARFLFRFDAGDGLPSYVNDTAGPEFLLRPGATGVRALWHPAAPEGLESCAQAPNECNERLLVSERPGLVVTEHGTLVLAPFGCAGFMEVHPFRRCARMIGLGAFANDADVRPYRVLMLGSRLTVLGEDGLLLQGEWTD